MPTFDLERAILAERPAAVIAGIDEAGRGPWAGPVVAAAVVFDAAALPRSLAREIDDSKKLTATARDTLFAALHDCAAARIGVGRADVAEIDAVNILQATYRAMARAVNALGRPVDVALVDGNGAPTLDCAVRAVVGGDAVSLSIAAASIVAKVTRDRIMRELAVRHPGYGWETNMGYGTPEHQAALARLGPTPYHRTSFAPIRALVTPSA
jgi:ribonuclease HII